MTPDEAREITERSYENKRTTKRFEDRVKIDIAIREAAHDGRQSCTVSDVFEPIYWERAAALFGWQP